MVRNSVFLVMVCCGQFAASPIALAAQNSNKLPDGLSAGNWADIRAVYEAGRHAAYSVENGFRARNPGQRWRTHFDGRGFTTEPEGGGWTWGLELLRYGFAGQERDVNHPASVGAEGNRVTNYWDSTLEEWYVNDARGLEHGYTVHQRPCHHDGIEESGPLTFTLAVRGKLVPDVQENGGGIRFVNGDGVAVLSYSGLTVFDADGLSLPARFKRVAEGLRLVVDESGARYPLTIDPIAQQAYLKASNTGPDLFGFSLGVSGDTVVVGAPSEDSMATGVNGNQGDGIFGQDSGAAYVFVRSGETWSQQAYLKASNTQQFDEFGWSVAVSGDTVLVGARGRNGSGVDSGAAYVFVRNGTIWSQQAYLTASNPGSAHRFGVSVSVSNDTIVVGATGEAGNATGVNGNQSSQGAGKAGAAYVLVRSGTTWTQEAYVKASNTGVGDRFGHSVAVSDDTLVVGALTEGSAATGVNGDQSDNSASFSGAAYVFARSGSIWSQEAYLKASNTDPSDAFGISVAVSGDTVVVGADSEDSNATGINGIQDNAGSNPGAAYVFVRSGTSWSQEAYLKASNTSGNARFGIAVAVSDDTIVVGAHSDPSNATGVNGDQNDTSVFGAGAAYKFERNGTSWSQVTYLKASNTKPSRFGSTVALSGNTVVVGAPNEPSSATGVNGDQSDTSLPNAGAVYVFDESPCSIFLASSEIVDLGSPTNPNAFRPGMTSGPVIGATWDPYVDHTTFMPRALVDIVLVQRLPTVSGPSLQIGLAGFIGTLICQPKRGSFFADPVPAGVPFSFPIPLNCSLVGVNFCAQAASTNIDGTTHLTNALRLTVGTF